ncbi:MAG: cell division protein FtsX [Patescibacteria group bacterium]
MRLIKIGLQNFCRNFWLSGAVVIILILMFLSISFLFFLNVLVRQTIDSVREKVDLSLYLKPEVTQNQLNNLKTDLENFSEIQEIKVISPQEAFESFKERHKNNPEILKSLEEININPFGPTLLVKTKPGTDINPILELVTSPRYEDLIQEKDFTNYQELINKIDFWGRRIKFLGFIMSGIFTLVAILVIFNAIRLSIYARLEEIKMMRLVGATAWSIKAPFLVEIFISIVIASLVSTVLFLTLVWKLQPEIISFLNLKLNLFDYLVLNILFFFGSQIIFAFLFCWLAANVAMKKYLKV